MHSVVLQSVLLVFVHVYTVAGFLIRYATDVEGTQASAGQLHAQKYLNACCWCRYSYVFWFCVRSHMQHKCSTPDKSGGIKEKKKTCGHFLSILLELNLIYKLWAYVWYFGRAVLSCFHSWHGDISLKCNTLLFQHGKGLHNSCVLNLITGFLLVTINGIVPKAIYPVC